MAASKINPDSSPHRAECVKWCGSRVLTLLSVEWAHTVYEFRRVIHVRSTGEDREQRQKNLQDLHIWPAHPRRVPIQ